MWRLMTAAFLLSYCINTVHGMHNTVILYSRFLRPVPRNVPSVFCPLSSVFWQVGLMCPNRRDPHLHQYNLLKQPE